VGFVVGKVALGKVFSEYFGFPWPVEAIIASFIPLLHVHTERVTEDFVVFSEVRQ
jgi:hypothetical protein